MSNINTVELNNVEHWSCRSYACRKQCRQRGSYESVLCCKRSHEWKYRTLPISAAPMKYVQKHQIYDRQKLVVKISNFFKDNSEFISSHNKNSPHKEVWLSIYSNIISELRFDLCSIGNILVWDETKWFVDSFLLRKIKQYHTASSKPHLFMHYTTKNPLYHYAFSMKNLSWRQSYKRNFVLEKTKQS